MVMIIVTSPVDSREATERMNKTRGPREEIWILARMCPFQNHNWSIQRREKESHYHLAKATRIWWWWWFEGNWIRSVHQGNPNEELEQQQTNEPNKLQEKSRTNGHHLKLFPYYYRRRLGRCWCSIFVPFFPFKTGNCVEWWSGIINSTKKNETKPSFDHPESHDSKAREEEGAAAKKSRKSRKSN